MSASDQDAKSVAAEPVDELLAPAAADEPLFDQLDDERRTAHRSCCTLWTLGLLLALLLVIGLVIILKV